MDLHARHLPTPGPHSGQPGDAVAMRRRIPSTPGCVMSELFYRTASLAAADGDGRTVHGVAVPFGVPAVVDDGYGPYRERFVRGAFSRTIRERGGKVKLTVNHDRRSLPVGRATELVERDDGLYGAFQVAATAAGDDVLELVRTGVVDSFSVACAPKRQRTVDGVVERLEVALVEVSLTGYPAYQGAQVVGVRSAHPPLFVDVARRRLNLRIKSW